MLEPAEGYQNHNNDWEKPKKNYVVPEICIYGRVTEITNGPNTAPADAQGTGGLFGAGGTS